MSPASPEEPGKSAAGGANNSQAGPTPALSARARAWLAERGALRPRKSDDDTTKAVRRVAEGGYDLMNIDGSGDWCLDAALIALGIERRSSWPWRKG